MPNYLPLGLHASFTAYRTLRRLQRLERASPTILHRNHRYLVHTKNASPFHIPSQETASDQRRWPFIGGLVDLENTRGSQLSNWLTSHSCGGESLRFDPDVSLSDPSNSYQEPHLPHSSDVTF